MDEKRKIAETLGWTLVEGVFKSDGVPFYRVKEPDGTLHSMGLTPDKAWEAALTEKEKRSEK